MPRRMVPLVTGEYYHVYNRGVARQPVFLTKPDHQRFLRTLDYYRFRDPPMRFSHYLQLRKEERMHLSHGTKAREPLVLIISFVLMPNHFHVLLKQIAENGISTLISRATNSYTRYFNTTHDRVGPLFQGAFKTVRVETDAQLIHLSRYLHLNPLVSHVVNESMWRSYPWSSLSDFLQGTSTWLTLEPILEQFPSPRAYAQFVYDRADYAKQTNRINHLSLET